MRFVAGAKGSTVLLGRVDLEHFLILFPASPEAARCALASPYGRGMAYRGSKLIRRVVTPKSNTETGAITQRLGRGRWVKIRRSRSICSRLRA